MVGKAGYQEVRHTAHIVISSQEAERGMPGLCSLFPIYSVQDPPPPQPENDATYPWSDSFYLLDV